MPSPQPTIKQNLVASIVEPNQFVFVLICVCIGIFCTVCFLTSWRYRKSGKKRKIVQALSIDGTPEDLDFMSKGKCSEDIHDQKALELAMHITPEGLNTMLEGEVEPSPI